MFIRSKRSQGERRDKRRARRFVQVSKCVLFFALANEWHNKGTILIYASAACLPRERRTILWRKHSIRVVEEIPARTGKMGQFYLGFCTLNFCRAVNNMRLTVGCFGRLNMTDRVGHPHPKRKLIRSVLINEMCLFGVSVRKANAEISAEQDGCTRMRGTVLRKPPRRRSGIIRGRYLSMRVPPVFPASDG